MLEILYIGVTYKIPDKEYPDKLINYDVDQEELVKDVDFGGVVYEAILDGVIERYDTWERETGDCIVVWRIPYRIKSDKIQQ